MILGAQESDAWIRPGSVNVARAAGKSIGTERSARPSLPYRSLRRRDDSGLRPHDRNWAVEDHLPGPRNYRDSANRRSSAFGDEVKLQSTDDSQDGRREEHWKDLVLATLGGNEVRARAAARTAAAAEATGHSADEFFDAARAAYQAAEGAAITIDGARPAIVIRPSGGKRFLLLLTGAVVLGVAASIVRFGSQGLLPTIGASVGGGVLICAFWMRCRVVVDDRTISVQGPLRRRRLDQLALSEIVLQPWNPWWQVRSPLVKPWFVATFVAGNGSTLLEMPQGAWTAVDIARIGAAIGVRVSQDRMSRSC